MRGFAIVVVAYNRMKCLSRLLNSLNNVDFENNSIPLIVSIDKSKDDDVVDLASSFNWKHGKKIVKTYPKRLGLRNHIIACGDFTQDFDHIAVFEDDIYVSPAFFSFAKQVIPFYHDDPRIEGIGLYSNQWNQNSNRPFLPFVDQYDVYFMQHACSWGQIWSRPKWEKFRYWYNTQPEDLIDNTRVPQNIQRWGEKSWLKYHNIYCIQNNKYFVYPKISLTTNFSCIGTHNFKNSNGYQVPLKVSLYQKLCLPIFEESKCKYDSFYELMTIGDFIGLDNNFICMDLYGMKKNRELRRYWLTLDTAKFRTINSYGLNLKPHEMNIILKNEGNDIFLYDTNYIDGSKRKKRYKFIDIVAYDIRNVSYKILFLYSVTIAFQRIKDKLEREITLLVSLIRFKKRGR